MNGALKTLAVYGTTFGFVGLTAALLYTAGVVQTDLLLYLVPVVVLAFFFAAFLDLLGALCMLLAWLPFSLGLLQIEVGLVTVNPYILGIFGLTPVVVYRIFMAGRLETLDTVDLLMLLLAGSFLASTLLAKDLFESGYLAFHAIFIPALSYFVVKGLLDDEPGLRRLSLYFLGGVLVFATLGLIQFAQSFERLTLLEVPAVSAATLFCVAIVYVLYGPWRWRWVAVMIGMVLLAALLTTFSRGYLVLLLISPVLYAIIRRGRAGALLTILLPLTLAGTGLLASFPDMVKPDSFQREKEQTIDRIIDLNFWEQSLYGRAINFREGFENALKHPYLGTGFHKGRGIHTQAVVRHNFHVEWLEYGGILGYLLYTALFLTHFYLSGRWALRDRWVAVNLLALLLVLLNGLTNSFSVGLIPYMGFIAMGLAAARVHQLRRGADPV